MREALDFLNFWESWHPGWRFLAALGAAAAILSVSVGVLTHALHRIARRTQTRLDDEILAALRWPLRWGALLLAVLIALKALEERDLSRQAGQRLAIVLVVLVLIPLTMALSRISIIALKYYLARSATGWHVTTLTAATLRILWAVPGALVVLDMLNVSLAPALTALGVGGIAVSLALKDTLANLFSGFYVSMAGNLHKGDYVRLESGPEGYVEDVAWRITTLRTLQNNLIVIPNSKLSESLVTNFSYPEKRVALPIPFGVSYGSDIARVERAVLEEVAAAAGLDGLLLEPAPVVRFHPGFGDFSLNLTLVVHVEEFAKQYAVQDALRRRILERFRRENIGIPYPVQTLDLPPGSLKRALEGR